MATVITMKCVRKLPAGDLWGSEEEGERAFGARGCHQTGGVKSGCSRARLPGSKASWMAGACHLLSEIDSSSSSRVLGDNGREEGPAPGPPLCELLWRFREVCGVEKRSPRNTIAQRSAAGPSSGIVVINYSDCC